MGQYGIENLKKIVLFAAELGNVAEKGIKASGAGAKITALSGVLDEILALSGADLSLAKLEASELDSAEKAQLLAVLDGKLDLENDKLELIIERSLAVAVDLLEAWKKIKYIGSIAKNGVPVAAPAALAPSA